MKYSEIPFIHDEKGEVLNLFAGQDEWVLNSEVLNKYLKISIRCYSYLTKTIKIVRNLYILPFRSLFAEHFAKILLGYVNECTELHAALISDKLNISQLATLTLEQQLDIEWLELAIISLDNWINEITADMEGLKDKFSDIDMFGMEAYTEILNSKPFSYYTETIKDNIQHRSNYAKEVKRYDINNVNTFEDLDDLMYKNRDRRIVTKVLRNKKLIGLLSQSVDKYLIDLNKHLTTSTDNHRDSLYLNSDIKEVKITLRNFQYCNLKRLQLKPFKTHGKHSILKYIARGCKIDLVDLDTKRLEGGFIDCEIERFNISMRAGATLQDAAINCYIKELHIYKSATDFLGMREHSGSFKNCTIDLVYVHLTNEFDKCSKEDNEFDNLDVFNQIEGAGKSIQIYKMLWQNSFIEGCDIGEFGGEGWLTYTPLSIVCEVKSSKIHKLNTTNNVKYVDCDIDLQSVKQIKYLVSDLITKPYTNNCYAHLNLTLDQYIDSIPDIYEWYMSDSTIAANAVRKYQISKKSNVVQVIVHLSDAKTDENISKLNEGIAFLSLIGCNIHDIDPFYTTLVWKGEEWSKPKLDENIY